MVFTLTGTVFLPDGATAYTGQARVTPLHVIRDLNGNVVMTGSRTASLSAGAFSFADLPDSSLATGYSLDVTLLGGDRIHLAEFAAGAAGSTVDLSDLVGVPTDAVADGFTAATTADIAALSATFAPTTAERAVRGTGTKQHVEASSTTATALRWVGLGDSIADFKMRWLYPSLNRAYGAGYPGASVSSGSSGAGWSIPGTGQLTTTGTITDALTDFDAWFSGKTERYATGATRTYGVGGVDAYWDSAKVYYVTGPSSPDGGTFKVQVDGVDEGATVNTNAGSIGLGIVNITKGSVAQRALKVINLTGAHRIVGVAFFNSSQSGVIYSSVSQGGISMQDAVSTAGGRGNLSAYLTDFAPDVVSLECKENSSYFATALATLLPLVRSAVPNATVVGIGSTPVATGDDDQKAQNAQLQAACAANGCIYWDGYGPVVDYPTLNALGWAGDGIHVHDRASAFLAGLMARDLGLLNHPGLSASAQAVRVPTVQATSRVDLGVIRQDGAAVSNAAITADPVGFDINLLLRRIMNIVPSTGTADALSWVIRPDGSADQQIPTGVRLGTAGPYLQTYTDTIRVSSARGGGNQRDVEARAFIAAGTGAYVRLPAVATASRPTVSLAGSSVFDTTLNKPIWWNGSAWVDATGATV